MVKFMNPIIRRVLGENRNSLLESEAKELCTYYGLPVPRYKMATTTEEALKGAKEIGYPLVMKVLSKDIVHKSDAGCVFLGIKSDEEIENAFNIIMANALQAYPNAEIKGVILEEMLPKGIELAVGAIRDPEFGPTVMFGLGGIFIEVMNDVTFRVAPITKDEAKKMMKEVKGYRLLEGYRGQEPADTEAIAEIIAKVSQLITENEEINQLDLNPIITWKKGAKIADAKILLSTHCKSTESPKSLCAL